jgi:hypothetical protein
MVVYGLSEGARIVLCSILFKKYSRLALYIYCPITLYTASLVRGCNLDIVVHQVPANTVSFHLSGIYHPSQGYIKSAYRADCVTDSGRVRLMVS